MTHDAAVDRGAATVLVVDDDPDVRALARDILQDHSYPVLEARSGYQALLILARHGGPVPLLLTDVVMPRMSGQELVRHAEYLRPGIRALYMSGYPGDILVASGVLGAGTPLLDKPFTPDRLARIVRQVLVADPAGAPT